MEVTGPWRCGGVGEGAWLAAIIRSEAEASDMPKRMVPAEARRYLPRMGDHDTEADLARMRTLLASLESGRARIEAKGTDRSAREAEKLRIDIASLERRIARGRGSDA